MVLGEHPALLYTPAGDVVPVRPFEAQPRESRPPGVHVTRGLAVAILWMSGCAEYNFQGTLDDKDDTVAPDVDTNEDTTDIVPVDTEIVDTIDVPTETDVDTDLPLLDCSTLADSDADGSTYVDVAAGDAFACAIDDLGRVQCWGANNCGQVSGVPDDTGFTAISAGGCHACALDCNGIPTCWGQYVSQDASQGIPAGRFTSIDSGLQHACAVRDGVPTCWGYDDGGGYTTPPSLLSNAELVAAGHFSSCALTTDGSVACFGEAERIARWSTVQTQVYADLDLRGDDLCVLDSTRRVVCYGVDTYGELAAIAGVGTSGLLDVAIGGTFVCVISDIGAIACYGDDTYDQLTVPSGRNFTKVVAGVHFGCGVTSTGGVSCWGRNDSGQATVP